jgi:ATP-dependent zinc metalloprotease ftsH
VASKIDVEVHQIVDEAYRDVEKLLTDNMDFLHNMANALLEEETIDSTAVENLHKYGTTKAPVETEDTNVESVEAVTSAPESMNETKIDSTESDVQS